MIILLKLLLFHPVLFLPSTPLQSSSFQLQVVLNFCTLGLIYLFILFVCVCVQAAWELSKSRCFSVMTVSDLWRSTPPPTAQPKLPVWS